MFAIKEIEMRLTEVLTESAIQELNEGPFGQAAAGVARNIARGAGAVAGGISAIPSQVKKGFGAGAAAVRGEPEPAQQSAPLNAPRQQTTQQSTPQVQQGREATVYSQVKGLISKLDKKGKQRILAALAKDLGIAGSAPAAKPAAPVAKAGNPAAPAGTPAAKPKVVRGGRAKAA